MEERKIGFLQFLQFQPKQCLKLVPPCTPKPLPAFFGAGERSGPNGSCPKVPKVKFGKLRFSPDLVDNLAKTALGSRFLPDTMPQMRL